MRSVSQHHDRVKLQVHTGQGEVDVDAGHCVFATGIPILDRGGFFARVKPNRSYSFAFDVPGEITRPMFISAGSPTRSVRYAPVNGGESLIVAGAGHTVGRKSPTAELDELSSWAQKHFPGAVMTHQWSAQDYTPIDRLPYVGPILPGNEKIYVATGFNKWGLSAGVAAGLVLSGRISRRAAGLGAGFCRVEPARGHRHHHRDAVQSRGRLPHDKGLVDSDRAVPVFSAR